MNANQDMQFRSDSGQMTLWPKKGVGGGGAALLLCVFSTGLFVPIGLLYISALVNV